MSKSVNLAFILTSTLALSAAQPTLAQTSRTTPHHNKATDVRTDAPAESRPAADSDESEGLSRDSEDCNKGCVDVN